jgi:transglutaminase superfamily protein
MRFILWKALFGLLVFDCFFSSGQFARLTRFVRAWRLVSGVADPTTVERVCDAVNHACVWYPKRVLCLQRSVVTTCLLRSCGVKAEMVMGAQKLPFKAHAWTEVNGSAVNERKDVQRLYAVWERC